MRITFIVPELNLTGGVRVVAIYAQLLVERGHLVTVVSPSKRLPSLKGKIKKILKWRNKDSFNSTYFNDATYTIKILKSGCRVTHKDVPDADIVIATWWETIEWVNSFPKSKGAKVHFVQGLDYCNKSTPEARVKQAWRLPLHKITIAKWLTTILENDFKASGVSLIPNSVDQNVFFADERNKQDRPTIGFLFSETESKGVGVALNVIDNLKDRIPDLRVIAFGAKHPATIDIPTYVELSINPNQDEIRLLYQQCDLWLCCSLVEGFGLTILEAMACRAPAVSTKCGGPEDIITEDINGYLCVVNDVDTLTDSAYKVLNFSKKEWKVFSRNAYKRATIYTWKDAAKLFEKSLQNLI